MASVVPAHENQFRRPGGADGLGNPGARGVVGRGGFRAEEVDAAMDVAAAVFKKRPKRFDDEARLLGGGPVIEVN